MVDEARAGLQTLAEAAEAALPLEVLTAPLEELTPAQALARVGLQGLKQLDAILSQPLDMQDLKQQRLIGDLALGANRLWIKAAEAQFRAQRESDDMAKLLQLVKAEQAKPG